MSSITDSIYFKIGSCRVYGKSWVTSCDCKINKLKLLSILTEKEKQYILNTNSRSPLWLKVFKIVAYDEVDSILIN